MSCSVFPIDILLFGVVVRVKAIRSALQTIYEDCDNPNPTCVNNIIVIFTDSQSAIKAIAQMQHHTQPIVTDILKHATTTQPE